MTAKNILLRDLYNDLVFTVRDKLLLLVEAQSTWTVNVIFRLFLYLAETWGEYIKVTGQNIYGTKKITLPQTEAYIVFTGERKGKPDTISLFEEFGVALERNSAPIEQSSAACCKVTAALESDKPRCKVLADERMIELKARIIFSDEDAADGAIGKSMNILQQYIAFSKEADRQFKQKGRTVESLTAAIETCKRKDVLREYLETHEKAVRSRVRKRSCVQRKHSRRCSHRRN